MIGFTAHFDGKVLVPDEPVDLKPNQKVRVTVEPDDSEEHPPSEEKPRRAAGFAKHLGIWMSDDFNAPLEEFAEYE